MTLLEIVGYCGSVLIALSLMMKSMVKLRWINLAGASTFSIYGLLLGAYPVFVLNGFITLVDIFYIFRMYRKKDYFEILEILNPNAAFLNRFLEYHCRDIKTFFPNINFKQNENPLIFFTLRNMLPVGLFIGDIKGNGTLEIKLDYVIPGYRDFKSAKYNYIKNTAVFKNKGINALQIKSTVQEHVQFLNKVGFKKDETIGENYYTFTL